MENTSLYSTTHSLDCIRILTAMEKLSTVVYLRYWTCLVVELYACSLRSRRLEVVGERENWRTRGRHARRVSFSRARFFSCALYFQAPAMQAIGLQLRDNVTTENLRKKNNKKLRYKQRETPLFFVNQSGSHVITCNLAAAKLMIH